MTRSDYLRVMRSGPRSLTEMLWLYLYREGIENVPLAWQIERLCIEVGEFFLSLMGMEVV